MANFFNLCPKGHACGAFGDFYIVKIASYKTNENHAEMLLRCYECDRYYLMRDCKIDSVWQSYYSNYFKKGILGSHEISPLTLEQNIESLKYTFTPEVIEKANAELKVALEENGLDYDYERDGFKINKD